jgi:hypothetical protein
VWQVEGGEIAYACAHCSHERHRWTPVDLAGDLARAVDSLDAHGALCIRPARLPVLASLGA